MNEDTNITVYEAHGEKFIFVWNESTRAELLKTFGRFATRPELHFTWLDACRASMAIRNYEPECCGR